MLELFKPSKYPVRLVASILKKLVSFGFEFFVGDVINRGRFRLFGTCYLTRKHPGGNSLFFLMK